MARIQLQISFQTPEDAICSICDEAGVKGKEANEVYHSLDAFQVWRDRFSQLYGDLLDCVHHSNPDDPPDLMLNFSNKSVGVEHTRLEPSHYGWMNALHHSVCPDHCIIVPSISLRPQNRDELLSAMLCGEGNESDMRDELNEWLRHCVELIRRKIEHRPEGVLVIQNTSVVPKGPLLRPVAVTLHKLFSTQHRLIHNWTILLHSRSNPIEFESYLITAHEDLQHRSNGSPDTGIKQGGNPICE